MVKYLLQLSMQYLGYDYESSLSELGRAHQSRFINNPTRSSNFGTEYHFHSGLGAAQTGKRRALFDLREVFVISTRVEFMSEKTTSQNKLSRIIRKYDLHGLGDELESYWVGNGPNKSLRDLADFVNFKILDQALRQNGVTLDRDHVKTLSKQLDSDTIPLTAHDLNNRGIDTKEIKEDFISYQTVHNYLCKVRDVEYKAETASKSERINALRKLHQRVETVNRQTVKRLSSRDQLSGQSPSIDMDIKAECPNCGVATNLLIYLQNGGCPSTECSM